MTDIRLPKGFISAALNSAPDNRPLEVLYVPHETDSHFMNGLARYQSDRREGARWRTMDGDSVTDYGLTVLAWRPQQEEMRISRKTNPQPADLTENDVYIETYGDLLGKLVRLPEAALKQPLELADDAGVFAKGAHFSYDTSTQRISLAPIG